MSDPGTVRRHQWPASLEKDDSGSEHPVSSPTVRAAVLSNGNILVRDDVAEPTPAAGQVLVQVKACGICGSDLHFAQHGASMLALGHEMAGAMSLAGSELDLSRDVY